MYCESAQDAELKFSDAFSTFAEALGFATTLAMFSTVERVRVATDDGLLCFVALDSESKTAKGMTRRVRIWSPLDDEDEPFWDMATDGLKWLE